MKTPSVAHTCRCTWWFSAEPKRCKKEMAPSRGRAAAGAAASIVTAAAALSSRSISANGPPIADYRVQWKLATDAAWGDMISTGSNVTSSRRSAAAAGCSSG